MNGWNKIFLANGTQKKAEMLKFYKTDFKSKAIKRDKEGQYKVIKVQSSEGK